MSMMFNNLNPIRGNSKLPLTADEFQVGLIYKENGRRLNPVIVKVVDRYNDIVTVEYLTPQKNWLGRPGRSKSHVDGAIRTAERMEPAELVDFFANMAENEKQIDALMGTETRSAVLDRNIKYYQNCRQMMLDEFYGGIDWLIKKEEQ
jgi:hypothetical protein